MKRQEQTFTNVQSKVKQLTEFLLFIDPDLPTEEEYYN